MYKVALTGGIGSGKSTAAALFTAHGVPIIDADEISHRLTRDHAETVARIAATLGREYLQPDGSLNRDALRQRVFSDPSARLQLQAILHPAIRQQMQQQIDALTAHSYCLLVIPLLVETGQQTLADRILVMDVSVETQIQRVMARSNLDRHAVEQILAAQASASERLAIADDILHNDDDIDSLRTQVDRLHALYQSLAEAE